MLEQIRFSTMKHQEVCLNAYHISVKKMCASCQFKEVENDGERVCKKMQLKVRQMSDGLKNAGKGDGVVRDIESKEIVIR